MSKINNLNFHFRRLETEEQLKPKACDKKRNKTIKFRIEIN